MKPGYWTLNDHEPVQVDLETWAKIMEDHDSRRVALDEIGDAKVSTVFLGLDHNFGPTGPPILFETMVFGGKLDGEMDRYATWDEAEAGHKAMVQKVSEQ